MKGLPYEVKTLIQKARESALLAIETIVNDRVKMDLCDRQISPPLESEGGEDGSRVKGSFKC